jgi:hypothetical protein
MRYHAKEHITGPNASAWFFEERATSLLATAVLLVRVMIAKVKKKDRLIHVVRNTSIRHGVAGWNCVGWVQEALQRLEIDGKTLGTGMTEWTKVRNAAMEYCQRKEEHRFDRQGNFDMTKAPTYELVGGIERIP